MPGKILIVEPLPTTRIVLKVKLSTAFYTVSQAASLSEALLRLGEDRPDLILLGADWSDPDQGLRQCRALQARKKARRCRSDDGDRRDAGAAQGGIARRGG